jgi:hypothetical protein
MLAEDSRPVKVIKSAIQDSSNRYRDPVRQPGVAIVTLSISTPIIVLHDHMHCIVRPASQILTTVLLPTVRVRVNECTADWDELQIHMFLTRRRNLRLVHAVVQTVHLRIMLLNSSLLACGFPPLPQSQIL